MVLHLNNTKANKKIVLSLLIGLLAILNTSILLIQISPVSGQNAVGNLTGNISDQAIDNNGDNIYDELRVEIEVNITTPGIVKAEVIDLSDSASNIINIINENSTYLDSNIQLLHMYLDGPAIYSSGINPEEISIINLYDESGTLLDSLSNTPLSRDYSYAIFGIAPAYLTRTITDEGVDLNDDGFFDKLLIGVEVNVTIAGTYSVEITTLYDESYNFVEVSNENSTYLDVGIHVVFVSLDGVPIFVSGINPNTIAIITLYDQSNTSIDEAFDVTLSETYIFTQFQQVSSAKTFNEIQREIILDQTGKILVINTYYITNLGFETTNIDLNYPEGADNFQVRDTMGNLETTTDNGTISITLRNSINVDETEILYINYNLPWEKQIVNQDSNSYTLFFSFERLNSSIEKLSVSINLPKGAKFLSSVDLNPETIEETDLQEILKYSFTDVTTSENLKFEINYKYDIFWGSFYPTIWIGILTIIGSAVIFVMGTPKPISAPSKQIPEKELRSYVDSYEEKMTIKSELESLDNRLRNGKIPRRRYKVRKKMLEGRLSSTCRNLSTLGAKIRGFSSKYSQMINEIEVAETKLEAAEKQLKRIKLRYRRGEISKGAHRKLLEEYQSQSEEAVAKIDGVLLRLRD
jgi:hypothetical protein